MKLLLGVCAILLTLLTAAADTLPVATIRFREAMLATKEGRKSVTDLQARFAPRKAQLENRQRDLAGLNGELRSGRLTRLQLEELQRKIALATRELERNAADLEEDARHETEQVEKLLASRLDVFLSRFAETKGLVMVVDSAAPGNAVRWVKGGTDITSEVIQAYDAAAGLEHNR